MKTMSQLSKSYQKKWLMVLVVLDNIKFEFIFVFDISLIEKNIYLAIQIALLFCLQFTSSIWYKYLLFYVFFKKNMFLTNTKLANLILNLFSLMMNSSLTAIANDVCCWIETYVFKTIFYNSLNDRCWICKRKCD